MIQRWTTVVAVFALLFAPVVIAQVEAREFRGTVTEKNDAMLSVENIKGEVMHFEILGQSLLPENLSVGDTVIVHHNIEGGESEMLPIVEVRLAEDVDPVQPDMPEVTAEIETSETDVELQADIDDAEADEWEPANRLPQTASPLAALVLTGLAALGGAATLRRRS